jgi:hypothetical protein
MQLVPRPHGRFFPVKVQVPIVMTVYAVMNFRDFALLPRIVGGLGGLPPNYFDVPTGYAFKTLGEALKEAEEEERRLLAEEMEERERESAALKVAARGAGAGGAGAGVTGTGARQGTAGGRGRGGIGGGLTGGKGRGGAPINADAADMDGDVDDDASGGWRPGAREPGAEARIFGGGGGDGGSDTGDDWAGGGGDGGDGVAELAAALAAREVEEEELM